MKKEDIMKQFNIANPVNYDIDFVSEQLDSLEFVKRDSLISAREERMFLNIICSALKYYLDASPEGYGEDIIHITDRLEIIYGLNGLFEEFLEMSV